MGMPMNHIDKQVFVAFAGIVEYLVKDLFKLCLSYIDNLPSKTFITFEDLQVSMFADKVISFIFMYYIIIY